MRGEFLGIPYGAATIAKITSFGTPLFLSSLRTPTSVSKLQRETFILAIITSEESPAFTIARTSMLVSLGTSAVSCDRQVVVASRSKAVRTDGRAYLFMVRILSSF